MLKLEQSLMRACPRGLRLPVRFLYQRARNRLEPELLYLRQLGVHGGRAIDVGANEGMYSYALSRLCDRVEAFEPQSACTDDIAAYSVNHHSKIAVHHVALSNQQSRRTLYIPTVPGGSRILTGLASLQPLPGTEQQIEVETRRLDEYDFRDVRFIKIDVEGHEREVLEGARETILRERPILQLEIEQRHHQDPIAPIFALIGSLGYACSFLRRGRLVSLSDASVLAPDERNTDYVHNFIFHPSAARQ